MNLLFANDEKGQYPASYYAASLDAPPPPRPRLEEDQEADFCVVGGGYAGLSAALHLARAGHAVVLLEAQRVGWGASGRNGGQVGTGQRLDQFELEKRFGNDKARALWDVSEAAKALVRALSQQEGVACDYTPGIVYADHKRNYVSHNRAYVDHLRKSYGYDRISFLDRAQLSAQIGTDVYFAGSLDWGAAHINPLKFALGLARLAEAAGVKIFEDAEVTGIERGGTVEVVTHRGRVRAGRVLLATNGYLGALEPDVAARVMPINSYIVATEPMEADRAEALIPHRVAVADSRFVVNYYRLSADNRMLFGGRESYGYRFPADIASATRARMLSIYPNLADLKIDYAWGGTLGITLSRLPYFARLAPNILTASGFSGHGVALATLGGKLMAEALLGQPSRFDLMAGLPTRRFPGGMALRRPLLVMAMLYFALRDRF